MLEIMEIYNMFILILHSFNVMYLNGQSKTCKKVMYGHASLSFVLKI